MKTSAIPVACSLTPGEQDERRSTVLAQLRRAMEHTEERPEGFAYRFGGGEGVVEQVAAVIALERQCCPFLRFVLTAEPGRGPVWLEVTGPEGTREFLGTMFADPAPQ